MSEEAGRWGTGGAPPWDGEAVRRLRAHLEATQAELAERLGTRQQTVSEWETGTSAPRRMSRRLLHLVAEEAGFYEVGGGTEPAGSDLEQHRALDQDSASETSEQLDASDRSIASGAGREGDAAVEESRR